MKRFGRTDANHQEIVKALRRVGASARSLAAVGAGMPDILVGFRGRNYLLEVKDGSKTEGNRPLTAAQEEFVQTWAGQVAVILTPEEAVLAVVEAARPGVGVESAAAKRAMAKAISVDWLDHPKDEVLAARAARAVVNGAGAASMSGRVLLRLDVEREAIRVEAATLYIETPGTQPPGDARARVAGWLGIAGIATVDLTP